MRSHLRAVDERQADADKGVVCIQQRVGDFVGVEGLDGLLTFTAEVSQETADALRDPAQFAET